MSYDNILNAVKGNNQLSNEDKAKNYQLFDELMKKGIKLSDLISEAEKSRTPDTIQTEVFSVMEEAVKGVPGVKESRQKANEIKSQIISEICLKDERYRKALETYRNTVTSEYVKYKGMKEDHPTEQTE